MVKEFQNTPVAAPQIENMTEALALFKSFKDDPALTMDKFLDFLNYPSAERDEFYQLFTEEVIIVSNRYAKRILNYADTTL